MSTTDLRGTDPRPTGPTDPTDPTDPESRTRRTRRGVAALSAALLGLTLSACAGATAAQESASGKTVFRYQGGTGTVSYPELAEDLGYFEDVELEWIGDVTGGPASIQAAVTGETEFGSAFNGAIAKLQSTGAPVTSVISSYGEDDETFAGYYTLEGSGITSARDLIGKKVGLNTLGAQYETVLKEWLAREGLTPEEVAQVELVVVPPVNLEQTLREGQIDVAALSGVIKDKALDRGGIDTLVDDTELYGGFAYGTYILRDDVIAKNRDAVQDFVQGTARAIRWAQTTPVDEVRDRFRSIIEKRHHTGETTDLVPYWKSAGISVPGGVIQEKEISVWVDWLEQDGQVDDGALTVDDLYTNEFNPYANGEFAPDAGPDGEEAAS
ncbi:MULTISPECIES: ABC transporter substrate-binding protein [unclassified Isoptericola]|uniref:ABC transporter substrate-binding protein n=1 Tax=unclassified Isoptericola TaxID=2623355 RepID=UPI003655396B